MVSGHGPGAEPEGMASLPVSGDPVPAVESSLAAFGGVTEMTAPPASDGRASVSALASDTAGSSLPVLPAPNGTAALPTLTDRPVEFPASPPSPAGEAVSGTGWAVWPTVGLESAGLDRSWLDGYFAELGATSA